MSIVFVVVIDWRRMGLSPPTPTSPTMTQRVLRLVLVAMLSQYSFVITLSKASSNIVLLGSLPPKNYQDKYS